MKAAWLVMVCIVCASSAMALEKMQVLSLTSSEMLPGSTVNLPNYMYAVNGVLEKQSGVIKVSASGEADMDFYTLLTKQAIAERQKSIPENGKIAFLSHACSVTPDNTHVVLTKAASTQICIENDKEFDVTATLFDFETSMVFLSSKPVKSQETTCFSVAPSHVYIVDINYCAQTDCKCGLYTNTGCQDVNGTLMMKRERTCLPSNCKPEVELVSWVNTQVKGCNIPSTVCKESDAGIDYTHFGIATKGKESFVDVCLDSKTVQEYYCVNNEIFTTDRFCNPGQACFEGECVTHILSNQTCGVIDGMLRLDGDEWCGTDRIKNVCKGKDIQKTSLHPDCMTQTCSYKNMTLALGESACLNDGKTIAKCSSPLSGDDMFSYSQCPESTRCMQNSKDIICKSYIKPEVPRQTRSWSIMDLINKLFKRDA
jgi:hypothetical protein